MEKTQEELYAESFAKHEKDLDTRLVSVGYRLLTHQESVQKLFDEGLIKPDRADAGNVIQKTYEYISKTGREVVIHTGILDGAFIESIKWVMVLDKKQKGKKQKKLFVKRFRTDHPMSLVPKLIAYGYLAKEIADDKRNAKLETVVNRYQWKYSDGKTKLFSVRDYFEKIPKEYLQIICNKEYSDKSYLTRTQPLVDAHQMKRLKDIRKTW